ncbi:hypothetical protein [Haliangium sp.]|uniref:hypothetical protein n=1 Tax=Haliangium sp. TaxID=2663208 RepID=UPI003D0BBBC9
MPAVPRRARPTRWTRAHAAPGWVALALATVVAAGCGDQGEVVARLVDHAGSVRKAAKEGAWSPVAGEDEFHCEDRLETLAEAWARVDISGTGQVRLAPETVIRFACAPGQPAFELEIGEALIAAPDDGEVEWVLDIGRARLRQGSAMMVRSQDGVVRYEVTVGSALVRRSGDPDETMSPGTALEIQVGAARVRRVEVAEAVADAGAVVADAAPTPAPTPAALPATVSGRRNQVRRPGEDDWETLPPGEHELAPGTEVRLGRGGELELDGGTGRLRWQAPGELVVGGPGQPMAELRRGRGTLESGADGEPAAVTVPGGKIEAGPGRAGAKAAVEVGRRDTEVKVRLGGLDLTGAGGAQESLAMGERATIDHRGRIEVEARAPARAEVVITAGESPVLHVPRPPVAVGVDFGEVCPGGDGVLEVARGRRFRGEVMVSRGRGRANVLLDRRPSQHSYRVRCLEDGRPAARAGAEGTIRVVRDAATRRLPRRPPSTTLDSDGRRYTVFYQNRLPELIIEWRGTADPGPYELHIEPERGEPKLFSSDQPRQRLRAGSLDEGTYRYYFQGAEARSKTSTMTIGFDNAAPSASLRAPSVRQRWRGDSLTVAGVALPGSRVSVAGRSAELDDQGRFSVRLSLPIEGGAVSVRLAHSRMGVHYYLRRDGAK